MKRTIIGCACLLTVLVTSTPAFAQCQAMFQQRLDWAATGRRVGFKLTSNRADGRYVSYAEGSLTRGERDVRGALIGLGDSDEVRQLFSDRKYRFQDVQRCTFLNAILNSPFNPLQPDRLKLEVLKNPDNGGASLRVKMTLLSWGNGVETITAECRNNMVLGFNESTQTLFTLSLFNQTP